LPVLLDAKTVRQYTPAEQEYKQLELEDPQKANQFNNWFFSRENRSVIKDGNEGMLNKIAILSELRGRQVTSETCLQAIGRVSQRSGGIHFTPVVTKPNQKSHKDDGTGMAQPKSERFRPDGKINHSWRDPAEVAAAAPAPDPSLGGGWNTMCLQAIRNYGTPSQNSALRNIYEDGVAKARRYSQIYSDIVKQKQDFARTHQR
jgi:hypothetical protein